MGCVMAQTPAERFDALFQSHFAKAYAIAYRITRSPRDAEDAVQAAFEQLWKQMRRLDRVHHFDHWFAKVVRNASLRVAKGKMESVWLATDGPDPEPCPEESVVQFEEIQLVRHALSQLEARHRSVLLLRYERELTDREIAGLMACPIGTVKSRLDTARRILKRTLLCRAAGA